MTETGADGITTVQTGESVNGSYTQTLSGDDTYTINESGTLTSGGYSLMLTGTDSPTQTEIGNSIQGTFNRIVIGGGSYTRTETGGTLGSTSSTNVYTLITTGNNLSGDCSQSEIGSDRFGLLEEFDNVADQGGTATPGHMYFNSFGVAFVDPSELIQLDVPNIWNYDKDRGVGTDPVLKLSLKETDGSLQFRVDEGSAFGKESTNKGYPFKSVIGGYDNEKNDGKPNHDTDSLQVAVRWKDKSDNDVGHETNAQPRGNRDHAADWNFDGKSPNQSAVWTTKKIPDGAIKVEIVAVYTDTIYGPGDLNGDLPAILASFKGELKDGKWVFEEYSDDKTKPRKAEPKKSEFAAILEATKKVLEKRTGYTLAERPAGFLGNDPASAKALREAQFKTNNGLSDTGYDILPR